MAPTGAGEGGSAPRTKIKGKSKTKSVRHLLAPPAASVAAPEQRLLQQQVLIWDQIIGFFNVKGRHTGAKLSESFTEVMVKWYIENRLFALTLDNASSNEVAVNDIISYLKENANSSLVCDGMVFHVRCACHILNLVARDGLKVI